MTQSTAETSDRTLSFREHVPSFLFHLGFFISSSPFQLYSCSSSYHINSCYLVLVAFYVSFPSHLQFSLQVQLSTGYLSNHFHSCNSEHQITQEVTAKTFFLSIWSLACIVFAFFQARISFLILSYLEFQLCKKQTNKKCYQKRALQSCSLASAVLLAL